MTLIPSKPVEAMSSLAAMTLDATTPEDDASSSGNAFNSNILTLCSQTHDTISGYLETIFDDTSANDC